MKKLLIAFSVYAIIFSALFIHGGYYLSEGWGYIDSSPYRDYLYVLQFIFLPLLVICATIHLAIISGKLVNMKYQLLAAAGAGSGGLIYLVLSIEMSSDPMAHMAYLGLFPFAAVFAFLGFVIGFVIQISYKLLRRKNNAVTAGETDPAVRKC
jgi:hypothetical protein